MKINKLTKNWGHPNPKSLMSWFCVDNRHLSFRRNWSPSDNGQTECQTDIVSFGNSTLPLPPCHLSHTQLEIMHRNSREQWFSVCDRLWLLHFTWFARFIVSQMQNGRSIWKYTRWPSLNMQRLRTIQKPSSQTPNLEFYKLLHNRLLWYFLSKIPLLKCMLILHPASHSICLWVHFS